MNPRLVSAAPAPIPDLEPQIVTKLGRILDLLREGTLTPEDFAYVRAGFFPGAARQYETLLQQLGSPSKYVLLERREVGDDRIYLYELTFSERRVHAQLGLAPDDRVSLFSLRPAPRP